MLKTNQEDDRVRRFRAIFVSTIACVVFIGFCLEARKYLRTSSLVKVERYSVAGPDFDTSYDRVFPRSYHATGLITLPYDDIVEPFEAWYAGDENISRIDYFHGMEKTIHRGDLQKTGVVFKIIPKHEHKHYSSGSHTGSCWIKEMSKWGPTQGQSVIPTNLSEFQFTGIENVKGQPCQKYVRKITENNKTNTYTLYMSKRKPHVPTKYEMIGYDDLLTSHYDHYILDYMTFQPWTFNVSMFKIPTDTRCGRRAVKTRSRYLMNPMSEYMHFHHHNDRELWKHFEHFKRYNMKDYKNHREHERRKHIFKHNLRFINSRNRRNLDYKLALNHFGDLDEDEMNLHRGLLLDEDGEEGKSSKRNNTTTATISEHKTKRKKHIVANRILNLERYKHVDKLPKNLDWRDYGAVTPVRSQGLCGSCWAFAVAGPIEAHHFFQTGKLEEISKQQLIDCTSKIARNDGCRGGFPAKVFDWVSKHGVATKKSYGSYLGQEGYCHCSSEDNCSTIHDTKDFHHVKPLTMKSLKVALAKHGPVSCTINADAKTLRFYSTGIYNDPEFSRKPANHAMLCVGYAEGEQGGSHWILKNTWGPLWGENGYLRIAKKGNIANIYKGQILAIKKHKDLPEFPFQSLKKVKRTDFMYRKLREPDS